MYNTNFLSFFYKNEGEKSNKLQSKHKVQGMTYNNNNTRQENRMYNQGFFLLFYVFIIPCYIYEIYTRYVYTL